MTKKQKRVLYRILIAGALLLVQALVPDQIILGERWVLDFTGEWVAPDVLVSTCSILSIEPINHLLHYYNQFHIPI